MMTDVDRRQRAGITQFIVQVGTIAIGLLLVVFAAVDLAQNREFNLITVLGILGLVLAVGMTRPLTIWLRIQRDRRRRGDPFGPV